MDQPILEGKISFVHHNKEYVTIDYTHNGKKKSINGKVDDARQQAMVNEKIIKKPHKFLQGDEVQFIIQKSARGDKMVAEKIQYRFNNALGNLINKTKTDNRFAGYLKLVEEEYFVKETGSYLFFPLQLSPWEIKPNPEKLNEPVFFSLENTDKPEKVKASLVQHRYIPEYLKAQQHFNNKTPVDAVINKITPFGIYVNVMGEKIQAKLAIDTTVPAPAYQVGQQIKIMITFLSPAKIVIAKAQ